MPETPPDMEKQVALIENFVVVSGLLPPSSELENYKRVLSGIAIELTEWQRMPMRHSTNNCQRGNRDHQTKNHYLYPSTIISSSLIATSGIAILLGCQFH